MAVSVVFSLLGQLTHCAATGQRPNAHQWGQSECFGLVGLAEDSDPPLFNLAQSPWQHQKIPHS